MNESSLKIIPTSRFRKDLKQAIRRGYNMDLLDQVVSALAGRQSLPTENRDHALTGNYAGFRECHIQPDWLLIYQIDHGNLILLLARTGTHSDLF